MMLGGHGHSSSAMTTLREPSTCARGFRSTFQTMGSCGCRDTATLPRCGCLEVALHLLHRLDVDEGGGAEGEGEEGRRGKCGFVAISPASQAGTRRRRLATSSERGKAKRRDKEPMHEDRHRPSFSVTAIPFQADLTQPPPPAPRCRSRAAATTAFPHGLLLSTSSRGALMELELQLQFSTSPRPLETVRFGSRFAGSSSNHPDQTPHLSPPSSSTRGHIEIIGSVNIETSAADRPTVLAVAVLASSPPWTSSILKRALWRSRVEIRTLQTLPPPPPLPSACVCQRR